MSETKYTYNKKNNEESRIYIGVGSMTEDELTILINDIEGEKKALAL